MTQAVLISPVLTGKPIDYIYLTDRERQVLALVAEGLTDREIGENLGLTTKTVSCYVSEILDRLDARNRPHAVIKALHLGFLRLE